MASEAQIAANRRNAEKSTGPKSARGKTAVGRNALRHGLTAERALCFDETEADFTAFAQGLRAALDPADPAEAELAERVVLCAWRLRRADRIDEALLSVFDSPERRFPASEIARVFADALKEMSVLSRYEAALDRALCQAYLMLERRQDERRSTHSENYETKPIFSAESAAGAAAKPIAAGARSQGGDETPEI